MGDGGPAQDMSESGSRGPFAAFYFDCDSTLSAVEGIDELTARLDPGQRADIRRLTQDAMEGRAPLARVYEERLALLAPSRGALEEIGRIYIDNLVPDTAATIAALQSLGKHVGIVSGGMLPAVRILARHLGIPPADVHAVDILFDGEGRYRDFDRASPLWQNDGKADVLSMLPDTHRPLLFCGDGVTDLEAAGVVDLFVGFGGVDERARVVAEAEVFLRENSLAGILRIGLTPDEVSRLREDPRFRDCSALEGLSRE
jgi:phosphoserine phosphatase